MGAVVHASRHFLIYIQEHGVQFKSAKYGNIDGWKPDRSAFKDPLFSFGVLESLQSSNPLMRPPIVHTLMFS